MHVLFLSFNFFLKLFGLFYYLLSIALNFLHSFFMMLNLLYFLFLDLCFFPILFSELLELTFCKFIPWKVFPRSFITHVATSIALANTRATNDLRYIVLIYLFKHLIERATSQMNFVSSFLVDKRLEHFVGRSKHEGGPNDVHFMHDFWIVILPHSDGNLNKVDGLFVKRRHRKTIHI